MSDDNTETNDEGTAADTFHVFQNETWMELNPNTLQIAGRDEAILLMKDDNLVLLEPEQLSHILRSGERLRYDTIRTTKRRARKKKRSRPIEVNPRVEILLEQLNAHMACMTKMLMSMPKWLKHSQTALTQEKHSTRQSPAPTDVVVTAGIHDKVNVKSISSPDRIKEKQVTPDRTAQGKNKEFVVSPTSIQAISEFSQKNLDLFNYKGRDRVSPDTFHKDDEYCRLFLYKFNPLVELTRSIYVDKLVKRALKPKETIGQKLPLTRFAATLGLVGVEKKKFMSEILERRRKQRTHVKTYQESGSSEEEYLTDSSGVWGVKQLEVQRETRLTKRKKNSLKVAAKKFKSLEESMFIDISSSEDGDSVSGDTFLPVRKKRTAQIAKKTKSRVTRKKDTSDDESDATQKIISELKSQDEVKLKSGRTADSKKSSPSKKSPNSSLRRGDLERILEDDTEMATAKENSEAANSSYIKNRVYTMVEDHIILSHVLKDDNSTLVKGTIMWKKFTRTFYHIAKHTRTWQSLKNRYLKYILPNIKLYGLSSDKERRLRATAYTGELQKTRRAKENSIFKVQPVMSASSALRQKESKQKLLQHSQNAEPVASTSKAFAKSSTLIRSSKRKSPASSTPKQSPKKSDPTYSELTRRFQKKAKVLASNSSGDASESGSEKEFQKSGSRRLYNLKE